jgi:hypothetical protein
MLLFLISGKKNENHLPTLAKLARIYLSIPATSAQAERNFSVAGDIEANDRCNLIPAKFSAQMFIKRNFEKLQKY